MSKEGLGERFVTIERTEAEQREQWFTQQDKTSTWQLRAETAGARLAAP